MGQLLKYSSTPAVATALMGPQSQFTAAGGGFIVLAVIHHSAAFYF